MKTEFMETEEQLQREHLVSAVKEVCGWVGEMKGLGEKVVSGFLTDEKREKVSY